MATSGDDEASSLIPRVSEKLGGASDPVAVLTSRHYHSIPNGAYSPHSSNGSIDEESNLHNLTGKSQHRGTEDQPEEGSLDQNCKDHNQHSENSFKEHNQHNENSSKEHSQDQNVHTSCNGYHGSHYNDRHHDGIHISPNASRSSGQDDSNRKDSDGQKETDVDKESDSSLQSRRRHLMISLTLICLCYIMGMLSMVLISSQYLFYRFAKEYFNITNVTSKQMPCAAHKNNSLERDINEIQARTSHQILYMDYCQFIPAMFVCLFVGSYADYLGRKYLIFIPLVGTFIKSLIFLLVIYLDLNVAYLFLAFAVEGVCGSLYVLVLGLSASIADVTRTATQRVLLFAVLEISLAVAGAVSQIGTGLLISSLGFTIPVLFVCVLMFLGAVIVVVGMPETLHKPDRMILNPCYHLRNVFGFYLFDGTWQQRGLFLVGVLFFFFSSVVLLGKEAVEVLYLLNAPFCWDSIKIGLFTGIRILIVNLFSIFTLKVLSKRIRMELIGMLGLVSGIASCTVEAFAVGDGMMYLSALLAIVVNTVGPISRTLLSRMAPAEKQGALFASVSALQTVCQLTSTTAYNQVYTATLNVFRGAIFMLIVGFLVIAFILLLIFTFANHRVKLLKENLEVEFKVDAEAESPLARNKTTSRKRSSRSADSETSPLLHSSHCSPSAK